MNQVSFSHIQQFDHVAVKAQLGNAVESFGSFMEMAKVLQKAKLSAQEAKEFVGFLVSTSVQLADEEYDVTTNRAYKKILALFNEEAKGIELVGHTKWGMVNAVTEYYDHFNPTRSDDARLNSAWFGAGERAKNQALDLLLV